MRKAVMLPCIAKPLSLLLLCLLIVNARAAPSVLAARADQSASHVEFLHVVQVLQAIVAAIDGATDSSEPKHVNDKNSLLIPSAEPDGIAEAMATDEPSADDLIDDLALPVEIPYKLNIVEPLSGTADGAVILLHGLGQTTESIIPFAEAAKFAGLPNIRFIMPQANTNYVTMANSSLPSWFDVISTDPNKPEAKDEIITAAHYIARIRDAQLTELGIPAERVAVVGVSQGGAVALTAYMRYRWAAAVAISSWLPIASTYPAEMTSASKDVELLMLHGSDDDLVLPEWARLSAAKMKDLGRSVEYIEIPNEGHQLEGVMANVLVQTLNFLRENLLPARLP